MQNLTLKARMYVLGLIAVGGIILAGGFGIVSLSAFNAKLEKDLADVRHGVHTLVGIQSASIDFKTQIQEWKNILIRGNSEEEFKRYEKAFFEKQAAVQDRLKKSLDALKQANEPENAGLVQDLGALIKNHAELGVAYKAALEGFDKADPEAGKKVDHAVKGKDRATTEGLNAIVSALEKSEFEHLERQIESAKESYAQSRNLLAGLMLLCFVLASGIVLLTIRQINRQISLVQESTAEIKQRLDLTLRIPVSGNHEIARVAASVNGLLDEFQAVVRRMKEAGSRVSGASDELSHSIKQLSSAVEQQNEATASTAA